MSVNNLKLSKVLFLDEPNTLLKRRRVRDEAEFYLILKNFEE